jgi:hypothetical protein
VSVTGRLVPLARALSRLSLLKTSSGSKVAAYFGVVPAENPESSEKSGSLPGRSVSRRMLALLSTLLSWLACRIRSRAELELELIALSHQVAVLNRQRRGRLRLPPPWIVWSGSGSTGCGPDFVRRSCGSADLRIGLGALKLLARESPVHSIQPPVGHSRTAARPVWVRAVAAESLARRTPVWGRTAAGMSPKVR